MLPSIIRTLLFLLLCLPLVGFDDLTHHEVEIVPHWKKGDSVDLTISRARQKRSADGRLTLSGKTHTRVTLEVLDTDQMGSLIGWTGGDTTFEDPAPSESFLRQVVGLMKGMQIVLRLDKHGAITGVQNWQELRNETVKVMDALVAKTPAPQKESADHTLRSNLRAQWDAMFSTKEQVEQVCTRDARIYFMVLGRKYLLNKSYKYTDLLPNPLGGEAFPTQATIALKAFDQQTGNAALTWNQTADPQHVTRIVGAMVKELAARRGKKAPEGEFAQTISMTDNADIVVDTSTGWINRLMLTRSITLGARDQIDTTTIVKASK